MVISRSLRRWSKVQRNYLYPRQGIRNLTTVSQFSPYYESRRDIHRGSQPFEDRDSSNEWSLWLKICGAAGGMALAWSLSKDKLKESTVLAAAASPKRSTVLQPSTRNNLPYYSASEVAEHYEEGKRVWVTFKDGVYDITDFIRKHPGGGRILMAAGGSLEPFWELYPAHKKPEVYEILEKLRIGNLKEEDIQTASDTTSTDDHFKHEPKRHVALISHSKKPCNAETPPYLLTEKFQTPNDLFYVRNHLPVPLVDPQEFQLDVAGVNIKSSTFTLDQIKKLPKVKVFQAIQCAGNRRADMNEYKRTTGLAWTGGAIGNAEWAGARLRDVLKLTGYDVEKYKKSPEKYHVCFEGLDSDPSGESYGASIPLSYLLDNNFEPIVAYEMNGEILPRDHGFPLRIILPGIVGARNVKWLARIEISDKESQSPWQKRDYKVFSPSTTLDNVDYSSSPPIMDTPITSYICSHENGTTISKGTQKFQGYAHSGGGRKVVRVEVSTDRGNTWTVVDKMRTDEPEGSKYYSWVLWEAHLTFPTSGDYEVWVKAVDSSYNQQPEGFSGIWNYRGLIANAYHRVKVKVQ